MIIAKFGTRTGTIIIKQNEDATYTVIRPDGAVINVGKRIGAARYNVAQYLRDENEFYKVFA